MTLHIFNPEHDLALASGLQNFTAPHAARRLRHDLGFLPSLWAAEGDIILVDDPDWSLHKWQRLASRVHRYVRRDIMNVEPTFMAIKGKAESPTLPLATIQAVDSWGWNSALCALLQRQGLASRLLPDEEHLRHIRQLSHRHTAASLLPLLREPGTLGEAFECKSTEDVEALLRQYNHVVMKAPWSSSGRGLRFLSTIHTTLDQQAGWLRNMLQQQGSVMVEPYYNKVKDFGMEFMSDGKGTVTYLGLSLFHTTNGAYTGNILATEHAKESMINHYLPSSLLRSVQEKICNELAAICRNRYCGPLGLDMMICTSGLQGQSVPFLLHPCVEINLRRTMGHVALSLTPPDDDIVRVMRIEYKKNYYELKIYPL